MWAALALGYLLAAIALFAALSRLRLPGNLLLKFLCVGSLGGLGLAAHGLVAFGPGTKTLAALLLYACACELYVFLFTMVSSSVSASLLIALRQGSLTEAQIADGYSDQYMVDNRIAKLIRAGLLARDDAGFLLTAKGRLVVSRFAALRRFFRHGAPADALAGPELPRAPWVSAAPRADSHD
jgi:hypothetical protein